MSNNAIGAGLRTQYGISQSAPASVTAYTANVTVPGTTFTAPVQILDGTDGADNLLPTLTGTTVFGMGGNDTIDASNALAVVMVGGNGSDVFKLNGNANPMGAYTPGSILDFEIGSDRIDLSSSPVGAFSQLTIQFDNDSNGRQFADITHSASGYHFIVTGLNDLSGLNASSFIFNGNAGTGNPVTPTPQGSNDTLSGTANADTLEGGAGNDYLFGAQGNDVLYGNQDSDTITGNMGNDVLYGGQGTDVLYGNLDNDTLFGNMAADLLYGGAGDDSLHGGQGADTLVGGQGDDRMNGGLGNDLFVFTAGNTGHKTIEGFQGAGSATGDLIHLESALLGGTSIASHLTVSTDTTITLGDLVITVTGAALTEADFQIV